LLLLPTKVKVGFWIFMIHKCFFVYKLLEKSHDANNQEVDSTLRKTIIIAKTAFIIKVVLKDNVDSTAVE
jgi:hypothetical protein